MLSKLHRLPAQEILVVLRHGMHIRVAALGFVYKKTKNASRFTVIISTKIDKRATARNRVKRLVREAVQHLLPNIQNTIDGVFLVRGRLPDGEVEVEKLVSGIFLREKLLKDVRGNV